MKLPFLDRDQELRRLRQMFAGRDPALACVYGRRRCGKSRLLAEALRPRPHVYYVADEREASLQRRALAREMARLIPGFDRAEYSGWEDLLSRWWRDAPRGAVLALDEFPALVASSGEIPSLLQRFVDGAVRGAPHTVVCGSSQRMMHSLVLDGTAPLYGRAREILKIGPLPPAFLMTALRLKSPDSAVEAYGIWGGIPRYWEMAAECTSRTQAVRELVMDPLGVLHREPERLLVDDLRDTSQSVSILSLVGQGSHRLSEIGARLGRPATALSRPLAKLVDLGYLMRETPFGSAPRETKQSRYRLRDPFLMFWFRFVEPNRSRVEAGQVDAAMEEVDSGWSSHLAQVWEDLSRTSVARLRVGGREWKPAQRWWGRNLSGLPMELDIVASSAKDERQALAGEVKVSLKSWEVDRALAALRRNAEQCPALAGKRLTLALWVLSGAPAGRPDVVGPAEVLAAV